MCSNTKVGRQFTSENFYENDDTNFTTFESLSELLSGVNSQRTFSNRKNVSEFSPFSELRKNGSSVLQSCSLAQNYCQPETTDQGHAKDSNVTCADNKYYDPDSTKSSDSDKENELLSLSLADLYLSKKAEALNGSTLLNEKEDNILQSCSLASLAQNYSQQHQNCDKNRAFNPTDNKYSELSKNSDSDKENEVLNFSLADLYFNKKHETANVKDNLGYSSTSNRSCGNEENSLLDFLDNINKSPFTEEIAISDSSSSDFFAEAAECLLQNHLIEKPKLHDKAVHKCDVTVKPVEDIISTQTVETDSGINNLKSFFLTGNDFTPSVRIDLSLAKKKNTSKNNSKSSLSRDSVILTDFKNTSQQVNSLYIEVDKSLLKKKPSLFAKVLCCKPKKCNAPVLPKGPDTLKDLFGNINYCQYFSFDSPSPDDKVCEKQKKAFEGN